MKIKTETVEISTQGICDIRDVTGHVADAIRKHGLTEGQATVFIPGATGGITTIEYEPGLCEDLPELFEKIVPRGKTYHHDDTWHDGNGFSHLRASLLGSSLTVPFTGGQLTLGTWQQIVLVDFDNRPRHRHLVIQVMGE